MDQTVFVNLLQVEDNWGNEELSKGSRDIAADSHSRHLGFQTAEDWNPGEIGQTLLIRLWKQIKGLFCLVRLHEFFPFLQIIGDILKKLLVALERGELVKLRPHCFVKEIWTGIFYKVIWLRISCHESSQGVLQKGFIDDHLSFFFFLCSLFFRIKL